MGQKNDDEERDERQIADEDVEERRRSYARSVLTGLSQHAAAHRQNEIEVARYAWTLADAMMLTESERTTVRRPVTQERENDRGGRNEVRGRTYR